jgi:hypothetical protein
VPSLRLFPLAEDHGGMIPLRPANASGAYDSAGRPDPSSFSGSAFNLSVNIRHCSYSYYIQRIPLQGTAKVPESSLLQLGESNRHWPASGLNR